jgi:hypothetical protein
LHEFGEKCEVRHIAFALIHFDCSVWGHRRTQMTATPISAAMRFIFSSFGVMAPNHKSYIYLPPVPLLTKNVTYSRKKWREAEGVVRHTCAQGELYYF